MKQNQFYNSPTDLGYQGKRHGGGCFAPAVLLICLIAVVFFSCTPSYGQSGTKISFSTSPGTIRTAFIISFPDSVIHVTDSAFTGRYILKLQKERMDLALRAYEWQELYYALVEVAAHLNTPQYNIYFKKWQALKLKFNK